jgi:hypothetical protein
VSCEREAEKELVVPAGYTIFVSDGDLVEQGAILSEGSLDLQDLFALCSKEVTQKYILKEIHYIYTSQGQRVNEKHIEIIIRPKIKDFPVLLTLDGQQVERVNEDDEIQIRSLKNRSVQLIRSNSKSYFHTLKEKFTHDKREL